MAEESKKIKVTLVKSLIGARVGTAAVEQHGRGARYAIQPRHDQQGFIPAEVRVSGTSGPIGEYDATQQDEARSGL
jgi:hypothetical protein